MRALEPLVSSTLTAGEGVQPRHNRFSVNRTAGSMPVFQPKALRANLTAENAAPAIETGQKFGFKDVLDVINPLQHIPIVSTFYRKATGDTISPMAQFAGGFLFGGPLGGVAAMTDIAVREQTGKSVGDRMMALVDRNGPMNGFGRDTTPASAQTPVIKLASRWTESPRMAGTIPVWGKTNNVNPIPAGNLAPDTNFAMLLNDLSDNTPV